MHYTVDLEEAASLSTPLRQKNSKSRVWAELLGLVYIAAVGFAFVRALWTAANGPNLANWAALHALPPDGSFDIKPANSTHARLVLHHRAEVLISAGGALGAEDSVSFRYHYHDARVTLTSEAVPLTGEALHKATGELTARAAQRLTVDIAVELGETDSAQLDGLHAACACPHGVVPFWVYVDHVRMASGAVGTELKKLRISCIK